MKKHLIAAAALATLSSAAFAQSATVYGIFDLSITKASNVSDGKSLTALTDAVWMPSVFGVTGSEDLGGGLKASFNLESDVNVDTGSLSAASGTKLFGRKSNVALSGNFGELKLGKDIDQIFLQGFIDNVRNAHSSSGFIAHTVAAAGALSTDSVFTENMVRYTTPTVGGFKAAVQYRFGESTNGNNYGNSTSLLANYSNAGFSLSIGTKTANDVNQAGVATANQDTELTYVGATYQLGAVRLSATNWQTKFKGSSVAKVKTQEYGVGYAVTPTLTAAVNYVETEQASEKGDITSASLKYALSKRTNLWTLVSRTTNNTGSQVYGGHYGAAYPASGADGTTTSVGITHSF
jgi:predicted porin